ncbi:MAG: hypothetical protein D3922_04045 [Candidatus Electrothrix sp. AR1]|nr:hypothetical protein [Candidatus Electrothrix sp. AR1]
MSNRNATDSIKGYFYQFDFSIEKLLEQSDGNNEITVEGVEDLDIETSTETTAIQCKYYSKTEYNHSVIASPIRLMLSHYKDVKVGIKSKVKYHLYGFYKSGQDKLILPITIEFLKSKFLTYKSNKVQKEHHVELTLSDYDLKKFLNLLSINIKAKRYSDQYNSIIEQIKKIFSCDDFEANYYYYNNALNEIREIAIKDNDAERKISKNDFLSRINKKEVLFNKWFLQLKGKKTFHSTLKDKYFRTLNKAPFERFFLIDLPPNSYSVNQLKNIVFLVSKKFSNLKKREPKTYCPYIYFHNISDDDLLDLKTQLFDEDFIFIDGFPFYRANFSPKAISIKADSFNSINIKIFRDLCQVAESLNYVTKTKEVYQFYFDSIISPIPNSDVKDVRIQINNLESIKDII